MNLETEYLMLFALCPFIGLLFSFYFSEKVILNLLVLFFLFILPAFWDYDFVSEWMHEFSLTAVLGCLYYFPIRKGIKKWKKVFVSIGLAMLLFVSLFFHVTGSAFTGSYYVEKSWG